ncbi:hypothetical protein G7Y79_00005g016370 [Physcia stellaris]|nr:hypothetical protein G7Y79_00005g016370 [Physcia stellaris]
MMASPSSHNELSRANFMSLPRELRNDIFRHLTISDLDCAFCPATWRPVGVDAHIYRIGYFRRDTVIPLMLVCNRFHEEVAALLYGENTFAFHISGFSNGPIAFIDQLPERYVQLMTKVYIRTGYVAADQGLSYSIPAESADSSLSAEKKLVDQRREVAISSALVKQAWPARYNVVINVDKCETQEVMDWPVTIKDSRRIGQGFWPYTVGHLWKMIIERSASGESVKSFRRIKWLWDDPDIFGTVTYEDART